MGETYIIGSEKLPVEVKGNYIQESFQGNTDIAHELQDTATGFVISNDSDHDLSFIIHGILIPVKAREVFEGNFKEFKSVLITANGNFRAYSKGSKINKTTTLFTDYLVKPTSANKLDSVILSYKGNIISPKQDIKLFSFGAWGSVEAWAIGEVTGTTFSAILAEGAFSGSPDVNGYTNHILSIPITLSANKNYIIACKYKTGIASKYIIYSTGDYLNNHHLTAKEGIYNNSVKPVVGSTLTGGVSYYVYDYILRYSEVL